MKLATKISLITPLAVSAAVSLAQAPFGSSAEQDYGNSLWDILEDRNLVGENAIMAKPYEGEEPHGSTLVTLESEISVDGQRGPVIVKRNYGGSGANIDSVSDNPDDYLMSVTVMFQREGYDPEHNDWFWAKYLPDGSYDMAPNGTPLVGSPTGCIDCHSEASGDMVYLNDRY